jgi:hypothetical protein
MRRKTHVRFLGEGVAVTSPPYPTSRRGRHDAISWFTALPAGPLLSYGVRVRHEVADVAVLRFAERVDSTCCSASSILPG